MAAVWLMVYFHSYVGVWLCIYLSKLFFTRTTNRNSHKQRISANLYASVCVYILIHCNRNIIWTRKLCYDGYFETG